MIPIIFALLAVDPEIVPMPVLMTIIMALLVPIAGLFLAFLAARVLTPRDPAPEKFARFEAGNPPYGRARGIFPMQYYPYLIVFLTVEPLVIYLFLIMMSLHEMALLVAALFATLSAMVAVTILFALDSARRLDEWMTSRTSD